MGRVGRPAPAGLSNVPAELAEAARLHLREKFLRAKIAVSGPLSHLPDLNVCGVAADRIVGTVPEAIGRLDPRRAQTWISGPSATSDIELQRVEGVHGPRRLVVLIVEP